MCAPSEKLGNSRRSSRTAPYPASLAPFSTANLNVVPNKFAFSSWSFVFLSRLTLALTVTKKQVWTDYPLFQEQVFTIAASLLPISKWIVIAREFCQNICKAQSLIVSFATTTRLGEFQPRGVRFKRWVERGTRSCKRAIRRIVQGICVRRKTINGRGVSGTLVSEKGTWHTRHMAHYELM